MNIEWVGSPNYTEGRAGCKPVAIVFHIQAGSEASTKSWFLNPASQVSAHYTISKTGRILQYVKEEDTAWANGRVNSPTWKHYDPSVNPNRMTIAIENEGHPQDGFTEAQIQANIWLATEIAKRWGIRVDLDTVENHQHLIGHNQLDGVSRVNCPGNLFPWDRVIDEVKDNLNGGGKWSMEEKQQLANVTKTLGDVVKDTHRIFEKLEALENENRVLKAKVDEYENETVPQWAVDGVAWAQKEELMNGYGNGVFKPNAPVTRAQLATILKRLEER